MDFTLNSSSNSDNELTENKKKKADKNLQLLQDHINVAAEHTKDLDIAEALEWTEDYLSNVGVALPSKLSSFLNKARSNDDVKEPYQGKELSLRSSLGAWGNLLAADAFNLLVAMPKVGKSALIVHVFACAKRGDETCLGAPIRKRWDKLIISGNDMIAGEWGKILIREGLAVATGDDLDKFLPHEDVIMWDIENPARMTEKGIKAMADKCLEYPDSLLVIDSLRSNTDSTLDENKAEIREPIEQMKLGLAKCKVTTVLIHHANKSVVGSTAVTAASGNNAISGSSDNTLLLKHLKPDHGVGLRTDGRIVATSSGRLQSDSLLVELTNEGTGRWEARGDAQQALLEEYIADVEERLPPRQRNVFDHAEELAAVNVHLTSKEVQNHCNLTLVQANKCLKALERKGLLKRCGTLSTGKAGNEAILYAPTSSSLARVGTHIDGVSKGSMVLIPEANAIETIETINTPSTHIPPRGELKASVTLPLNSPVEINKPNGWQSGYLLANGSDPDKIIAVKTGNLDQRIHNLRWGIDVRACASPFPAPATFDDIDF